MSVMEVHLFTEYHDSTEQEYGKIAKSYADFTIRHYGSSTTVAFDGCDEGPPVEDDTHQRRGHHIHTVASQTESDPDDK